MYRHTLRNVSGDMSRPEYEWMAFAACCLLIAAISVHDAMLVILNHELIAQDEQNPIGRWLISLQGGQVWLFVAVKLLGTAIVCAVLITLFKNRRSMALTIAGVLAGLQIVLLLYLSLA